MKAVVAGAVVWYLIGAALTFILMLLPGVRAAPLFVAYFVLVNVWGAWGPLDDTGNPYGWLLGFAVCAALFGAAARVMWAGGRRLLPKATP